MPTNGMTIDSLNTVSSLTAQDEVPVWDKEASGEPTRKITAQNMTNSVKTLGSLVNTTEMNNAIAQSTADVIRTGDVVNSLTSSATDKPLSAAQGKELSDRTTVDGVLGSNNVASSWNVIKTGITLMPGRKAATTGYPTFESENSEGACITIASPSSVNYARQLFIPNNKLSISAERIISGGTIGDWKQVSQIGYFWCETGSNITYKNNGRLSIVVTAPSNQNLIIALVATDGTPYAAVGTIPSSITISRTSGTGTSSVIKVSNAVGWTLPIWVLRA